MNRRPQRSIALAIALACLASGCGNPDEFGKRYAISGTVTLDGQPLKAGTVVFVPNTEGPAVQGAISEGTYSLRAAEGPTEGAYRVEIHSIQSTGEKVFDKGEGELIEQTKDLIPAAYNTNSKLEATVKAGGDLTFDFKLETPTAPSPAAKSERKKASPTNP